MKYTKIAVFLIVTMLSVGCSKNTVVEKSKEVVTEEVKEEVVEEANGEETEKSNGEGIEKSKEVKTEQDKEAVTEFKVLGETKTLSKGDYLRADKWDNPVYTYNGKSIKAAPVLCKDITIGSKLEDVLEAFQIKPGYAIVDRETDPYGDGCTDVIKEEYQDTNFFISEGVLDATFIFGYQKNQDTWELIPYKQLEEINEYNYYDSDVILYQVTICGPVQWNNKVGVGNVIAFDVSYLSPKNPKQSIANITFGDKTKTLVKGDSLYVNNWKDSYIWTFNGKKIKDRPLLYRGITTTSSLEEVFKAFAIQPGYAIVNRKVIKKGKDGETVRLTEEYKDMKFYLHESVFDTNFIFGYEKIDGKWEPMPYKDLEKIRKDKSSNSDVILYQIDICGPMEAGHSVHIGDVIQFKVSYLPSTNSNK